jgi:hypothetical protein
LAGNTAGARSAARLSGGLPAGRARLVAVAPSEALPPGALALLFAGVVGGAGTGLFLVGGLLYMVRRAGFSIAEISFGLTVAGLAAAALTYPAGWAVDRVGARTVAVTALVIRAAAVVALVYARSVPVLIVSMSAVLAGERGGEAAHEALVGRAQRALRPYLLAAAPLGVAAGAVIGGGLVLRGSPAQLRTMLFAAGAALLCAAALLARSRLPAAPAPPTPLPVGEVTPAPLPVGEVTPAPLPVGEVTPARPPVGEIPATRPPVGEVRPAPGNRVQLAAAGLHGVLSLSNEVLTYALPLWVTAHAGIPFWLVALAVLLNSTILAAGRIPGRRRTRTPRAAATALVWAGLLFLLSCALFAVAGHRPAAVAVGLILAAVVLHSLGEVYQARGIAPEGGEHAGGRQQALFDNAEGVERALAPAVLGVLCLTWGPPGWITLGVALVLSGSLLPRTFTPAGPHPTARAR